MFKRFRRVSVQKAGEIGTDEVLRKLRSFLDTAEPRLVYFLVNTWNAQGRAITYKELREAILNGDIDSKIMDEWYEDYSRFVLKYLKPAWEDAMIAATDALAEKYPDWYFNPSAEGVFEWTKTHSAEFVTNVTQTQIEGLRAVIRQAANLEHTNVDQLARAIRPMVGLTRPQSVANLNYYNKLIESGVKEKKALDLSVRYAARQHRYRGYMIARQEMAMSYNTGADQGVRQAQAAGYMGEVVKVFACADDERVCPYCGGLEGTTIGMDEEFQRAVKNRSYKFTGLYPPVHIQCRCTVLYKEVKPPRAK